MGIRRRQLGPLYEVESETFGAYLEGWQRRYGKRVQDSSFERRMAALRALPVAQVLMHPVDPPVRREYQVKLVLYDEHGDYIHHVEVSGNVDVAGLVNAAHVKLLHDLREVGYEGGQPIQVDEVPDTLPEDWT